MSLENVDQHAPLVGAVVLSNVSGRFANMGTQRTKLAKLPLGKPSIITASSTPISTPSSRAFVATIPRRLPEKASFSILRRS